MAPRRKAAEKAPKFTPPAVVCQSLDDADRIFADWQDLDGREAVAKAECAAAQKAAKDRFKEALYVVFPPSDLEPGGRVPFADRREQFEKAIEAYAVKHRNQVLLEGLKSRELNYGTLGWKIGADSIGVPEGRPEEGNQAILEDLQRHLQASLERYKGIPAAVLACLNVQVSWSREALGKALADGKITKEDLRSIGFKHCEGEDDFFAKPHKPNLASIETGKSK
jgi:hypothetical protein